MRHERDNVIFKDKLETSISMKSSRRELSVNVVIVRYIGKNNQITLFPCFTLTPKTGVELPKTGIIF